MPDVSSISMLTGNSEFSVWGSGTFWLGSRTIPSPASHKRRAPDPEADRGALLKQLDHGHRWPVPVEKSPLLNKHVMSVPSQAVPAQKVSPLGGKLAAT